MHAEQVVPSDAELRWMLETVSAESEQVGLRRRRWVGQLHVSLLVVATVVITVDARLLLQGLGAR